MRFSGSLASSRSKTASDLADTLRGIHRVYAKTQPAFALRRPNIDLQQTAAPQPPLMP
jgi:hypothetical protein